MDLENKYRIIGFLIFFIGISLLTYWELSSDIIITYNQDVTVYSIISVGLLILLLDNFKTLFFKAFIILLFSIFFSMLMWTFYAGNTWGRDFMIKGAGIISGFISGILFLIMNNYLFKNKLEQNLKLKKIFIFLFTLLFTSIIFEKGGDWLFWLQNK